jgi:hypothetical protein
MGILFFKPMNFEFTCIASRITIDLPGQIWEAQALNPPNQVILSRLLYNKYLLILSNYTRCYVTYFSPEFLTTTFTVLGLVLYLVGVYFVIKNKNKSLIAILLISPLIPLFELGPVLFRAATIYFTQVAIMFYGLIKLKPSK